MVPPLVDHDFPNKNTWGGFNDNDTWDLSESVENRVQRTKAARSQARSRSQSGLHPSSSFYLFVAHGPPLMSPSVFFVVAPAPPSFSERCKHISDVVG